MSEAVRASIDVSNVPVPQKGTPASTPPVTPAVTPTLPQQGDRPAWLPAKFKSAEDMPKAYGEAESELGKLRGQQTPPAEQPPQNQQTPPADKPEGVNSPKFAKYSEEWTKSGKLSDESIKELETVHGFPREMVEAYLEGAKAKADTFAKSVYEAAGGQEAWKQTMEWANANLSDADKADFNAAINSGNVAAAKMAVKSITQQYEQEFGKKPNLSSGQSGRGDSVLPFASTIEMREAMANPKYRTDPNYQAQVRARLAKSDLF